MQVENDGSKDLLDALMDETSRKGMIVQEDDLVVGQLLCVHSIKGTDDAAPIMGQSMIVTAICLPYFTAKLLASNELLTLDVRFLRMMAVTAEFAKSQKQDLPKRGPQA